MRTLVVNPGSSSLKVVLLEDGDRVSATTIDHPVEPGEDLHGLVAEPERLDAVVVRFVHGGPEHTGAVLVDDRVLADLVAVTELAPLHNPPAVAAARALVAHYPHVPVVACFDTTFHTTIPAAASTYALPREWNRRWGLRRYGFHGLSHAWAVRRAAELLARPALSLRVVSCHLGGGASVCAVRGGRSVDTTMGFTPMEGLVMQSRSGSVDPGLLLHLLQRHDVTPDRLAAVLDRESGLKGLSGTSGDIREVLAAREEGHRDAGLALDVYVHRLVGQVAAMTASAGGLDVLVFTGGVGEHAPVVRSRTAAGLAHLGVSLDEAANAGAGERVISATGSAVRVVVVEAREDLEMERQARALLRERPAP
ncbi:acetate/propionate family kinase [Nocardioides sp. URHA0020]|uniref:acetate/propionate family kinase n=1 Tax=Nocardioides sp. URHA0020 TaxID=1380392 RepID=UPI00048EC6FC|nr:acetate/propionate family kinase [Nocardioides sp. URHA0020]